MLYQPLGGEGAGEGTTLLGSAVPLCVANAEGPCAHFEVMTEHLRRGVLRLTCSFAMAWSVHCGGDDFQQDVHEATTPGPGYVYTSESSGDGDDFWDEFRDTSEFDGGDD